MSSLWDTWAELTRFLESARLAFARERALWQSLELANPEQAKLKVRIGNGWYKARLDQHVQAVADEEMLYAQCSSIATPLPSPRPSIRSA